MVLSNAALAALEPRGVGQRPARYALELEPEQDPRAVADEVTSTLPEFGPDRRADLADGPRRSRPRARPPNAAGH